MKKRVLHFISIATFAIFCNCTAVSEDDLIDIPIPEEVTFIADIKPIIDNNCIRCHANPPLNGAPMPLITYENVKDAVENRNLIGRISSEDLAFMMPFGGPRLPQDLIDLIIQWNEDGLLNE